MSCKPILSNGAFVHERVMQLNEFIFVAVSDDTTESVATHSSRLHLSIICIPVTALMFGCSSTKIYNPGMKAQVSLETLKMSRKLLLN